MMGGCEIKRNHGLLGHLKSTELRWVCPACLEILESPESATMTEVVEVPRRRLVAPFVMPIAGLAFVLAVVSEILYYWH